VADPEQDRIVIVDIASGTISGIVPLIADDEPGKIIRDDAGLVHVVLRRSGMLASIDPARSELVSRRSVCAAPRGVELTSPGTLTVACADGKLVTLPAAGGEPTRTVKLDTDLRDVVVSGGSLVVSRLKSTELLRVGEDGSLLRRDRPSAVLGFRTVPVIQNGRVLENSSRTVQEAFKPVVAWRAIAGRNSSVIVVHQRAVDAEVELVPPTTVGVSSYGGGGGLGCGGISQNAITVVGADGSSVNMTLATSPLPVDATLLSDGRLVVAHAGLRDPSAERPFVQFVGSDGSIEGGASAPVSGRVASGVSTLSIVSVPEPPNTGAPPEGAVAEDPGCMGVEALDLHMPAVAVAENPVVARQLIVQTRQPSGIMILDPTSWHLPRLVSFDDGSTLDTGYDLFHRDSGAGIACASCHPEGGDDGNVWRFSGHGPRKTQSLQAQLRDTAPFHWDGAMAGVSTIMSKVFVERMGGIYQSEERLGVLRDWLFALTPPIAMRAADDPAAQRGHDLFVATGCTECHSGPAYTNNRNENVGTGERLQVPSLVGVAYRAPFMHTGCAQTLADRFDPACGGADDAHGRLRGITPEEIGDLVAYLETL
jgi:hypothetical protein